MVGRASRPTRPSQWRGWPSSAQSSSGPETARSRERGESWRARDTPRFDLGVITKQPHSDGPPIHLHEDEDDSFYVLGGEITFVVEDGELVGQPGTFVLVPPGVGTRSRTAGDAVARMTSTRRPASTFRLEADRGRREERADARSR